MPEQAHSTQDHTPAQEGEVIGSSSDNKGMAYLAYIIFFIPLLTDAKQDPFVKYHVGQGLVLFLGWVSIWVLGWIPLIGWLYASLGGIFYFVCWILGLVNVSNDAKKPLPLIGQIGEKFKL